MSMKRKKGNLNIMNGRNEFDDRIIYLGEIHEMKNEVIYIQTQQILM